MRKIKQIDEQKVKRMNLNVPVSLHNSFKAAVALQNKEMTEVLLEFIEEYVSKHNPSKPKGRRR